MTRSSITVVAFLTAVFASASVAQLDNIPNLQCPRLDLFPSKFQAVDGELITLKASLSGGNVDLTKVQYHWTVSPRGYVESGQGTPLAVLDTSTVKGSWAIVGIEVGPFQMCPQWMSQQIAIRRKGPYTKADDFWWWLQLHEQELRAYKSPDYPRWLSELNERLADVDERFFVTINHDGGDDIKRKLIVGYRGKRYDAKVVNDFLSRAPDLAGFAISAEKPLP